MTGRFGIGGFFGLEPPTGPCPWRSVLDTWARDGAGWIGFHNARSAFAFLVRSLGPRTLWLPHYLCADMDQPAGVRVRSYGDGGDAPIEEGDLAVGDMVLATAFFGAPVIESIRRLAARRRDVIWVEDRAQALLVPEEESLADAWRLYSPRKLLGVADGGLLVGRIDVLPSPDLAPPPREHLAAAPARAAARSPAELQAAYARYREIERDHRVADLAMSDRSREILSGTGIERLAERRRANFAILHQRLADVAAPVVARLRRSPAPFGYPVLIERDRDGVAARLASDGFFCAVHWRDLVRGAADSPAALALASRMLTLPVDHRYGANEMDALADRLLRELAR